MTTECSRSAEVSKVYNQPGNAVAALDMVIELAEQLEPDQLDRLVTHIDKLRRKHSSLATDVTEQLTEREKEVLILVASGYNRKEIGRSLSISACTAAKHISNIYRKLGVSTIAEATRMALVQNISLN